jgi:hypothetical protein
MTPLDSCRGGAGPDFIVSAWGGTEFFRGTSMFRRLMACTAFAGLLFATTSCGGSSGDASSDESSDEAKSKKASPKPAAPRVEGMYDTGNGFIVTITPKCKTGACDVVLSYNYPRGSVGGGTLKFDGKAYDGFVKDETGCMVNFVFGRPAATARVHYHFTAVGGGDTAQKISGTRDGKYHLVGKYKKAPGCLPKSSTKAFQGTRVSQ